MNSWRPRMAIIESQAARLAARPAATAASSTPRSRAVVVLFSPARYAAPSSTPRSSCIDHAPSERADACARAAPTRSIRMLVARLLERVIMRSSRSRTERFRPTRAYSVESESSSLPTTNAPSTRDAKAVCTVSESLSPSSPASASRKIWIITGSFIVLAAWKRRFAAIRIESGRTRDR